MASAIYKIINLGPNARVPFWLVINVDDPNDVLYAIGENGVITDRFTSKREAGNVFKAWRSKQPYTKIIPGISKTKVFLNTGIQKEEYLRDDGSLDIVDEKGKVLNVAPIQGFKGFDRFLGRQLGKGTAAEYTIVPSRVWQGAQMLYAKANPGVAGTKSGINKFLAENVHTELLLLSKKIMGWSSAKGIHVRDLPTSKNVKVVLKQLDKYIPEETSRFLRESSLEEFCELILGAMTVELRTIMTDIYKTVEITKKDVNTALRVFKFLMGPQLTRQNIKDYVKKTIPQTQYWKVFEQAFTDYIRLLRKKDVKSEKYPEAEANLLTVIDSYIRSQGTRLEDPYKKYAPKKLEEKIYKDVGVGEEQEEGDGGTFKEKEVREIGKRTKKTKEKEKSEPAEKAVAVDPTPAKPKSPNPADMPDPDTHTNDDSDGEDVGTAIGPPKKGYKMEPSPKEDPKEKAKPLKLDKEGKAIQKAAFLDDEQAAATVAIGKVCIASSAGSGKTRILVSKVKYFIDKGYKPQEILTTTFSRKAADEMGKRLKEQYGITDSTCGTTHSISAQIIKEFRPDLSSVLRKVSPATDAALMRIAYKQIAMDPYHEGYHSPKARYSRFYNIAAGQPFNLGSKPEDEGGVIGLPRLKPIVGLFQNNGVRVSEAYAKAKKNPEDDLLRFAVALYGAYEWLKKNDDKYAPYMDFQDWLLTANDIIQKDPKAKKVWQSRYRVVMIDEAQDLNAVQHELFGTIGAKADTYAMIGDDKQAIYSWRGAKPSEFIGLKDKGFAVKSVTTNYRSGKDIVDSANKLIAHNGNRQIPMECKANVARKGMGMIRAQKTATHHDSAEYVGNSITEAIKVGDSASDYGIAVRNNAEADAYCISLMTRDIPYRSKYNYFNKPAVKAMLAWITINTTTDPAKLNSAVVEAANAPSFQLGGSFGGKLTNYAKRGETFYDALVHRGGPTQYAKMQPKQDLFAMALQKIREAKDVNTSTLLSMIFDIKGPSETFREMLIADINPEDLSERLGTEVTPEMVENAAMVPLKPLIEMGNNIPDPEKLMHYLIKLERANVKNYHELDKESREPAVQVGTVHSWKGLEVPHMFVSMPGGVFPNYRNDEAFAEGDEEAYDDERRLAYVAITRGEDSVTIMSPQESYLNKPADTSRFIEEACIGIGEEEDALPPDPEVDEAEKTVIPKRRTKTKKRPREARVAELKLSYIRRAAVG